MGFINQTSGNFKVGDYFYSAKVFDAIERIEPNPKYWEGKRGAIIGVFKLVAEHSTPPYVNGSSIKIYSSDYVVMPSPLPPLLRLHFNEWAFLGECYGNLCGFFDIKIPENLLNQNFLLDIISFH